MNTEQVSTLAIAASQIGPDFYAVLLITVVTAASGGLLLKAQKSKPSLSSEQLRPYRLFFYLTCAFGMAAVTVSIGWWLYRQTHGTHTAQIAITNISPNIRIDSQYFSKKIFRINHRDGTMVGDEYFLIVSDHPFSEKDKFSFSVFVVNSDTNTSPIACITPGGVATMKTINIPFSGKLTQSFRLEVDTSSQPNLISVASSPTSQWFSRTEIQLAQLALGAN